MRSGRFTRKPAGREKEGRSGVSRSVQEAEPFSELRLRSPVPVSLFASAPSAVARLQPLGLQPAGQSARWWEPLWAASEKKSCCTTAPSQGQPTSQERQDRPFASGSISFHAGCCTRRKSTRALSLQRKLEDH